MPKTSTTWYRIAALAVLWASTSAAHAQVTGWLNWRGPYQNGVSTERSLPDTWSPGKPGENNHLWDIAFKGRGTPVIARYPDGDRLYAIGYRGEKEQLREIVLCLDAATGRTIWEHAFADFLSDVIYDRYGIGAPTVDPQTGDVFTLTAAGLLIRFDRDGNTQWSQSLMETLGRLTFPNGRTGAPAVIGNLVIINAITSNWGREGPARNRFYAFDKTSGDLVWSSDPGVGPPYLKDSSFATPVFEQRDGRLVFYATLGDGNVVAVNALNGDALWRYQLGIGGVNSSVVLHYGPDGAGRAIVQHGVENPDDSGRGRMVALPLHVALDPGAAGPVVLTRANELWRNDTISMFSSSPVVVGDRVYQMDEAGFLHRVDALTGRTVWRQRLGSDQLHASPLYADGKLYIPTWHDGFYILRPGDTGAEALVQVKLEGDCLGSPALWAGRIYVLTTQRLYCFGRGDGAVDPSMVNRVLAMPTPTWLGAPAGIRVTPAEVLLRPGQTQRFRLNGVDAMGHDLGELTGGSWKPFVPPTARVKSQLNATFNEAGAMVAAPDAGSSAGAFMVQVGDLKGVIRGRTLPSPPFTEDFESFELTEKDQREAGRVFAYPPLAWIGARLKWEVQELDGSKVLAKTLDNVLFMRSVIFMGHPEDRGYAVTADVRSDGNRRQMSTVGVVNQRYIIALDGNAQKIVVTSNFERFRVMESFRWKPQAWYRLKAQVDTDPDGAVQIRGKAWLRDEPEPEGWTITATHPGGHREGSPGIYGFAPQSNFRVYVDNIQVTPHEPSH